MEALETFTHLLEQIPQFQAKIDHLAIRVAVRHAEFVALSHDIYAQSTEGSNTANKRNQVNLPIRKRKNLSTESLRHDEKKQNTEEHKQDIGTDSTSRGAATRTATTPFTPVRIDPENKHLFRDVREARRKRRSISVRSSASGSAQQRPKPLLTIYYDSFIQEAFDTLVRNIGSARNSLRKGKAAARFKARMASHGMQETPRYVSGNQFGMYTRDIMRSDFLRVSPQPFANFEQDFEVYDRIDKELEVAQNLCELGAHFILRDGDCQEEVDGVKERFLVCQQLAAERAVMLRMEAEKEKTRVEKLKIEREQEKERQLREKEAEAEAEKTANTATDLEKRQAMHEVKEVEKDANDTDRDSSKFSRELDRKGIKSSGLISLSKALAAKEEIHKPAVHMTDFPALNAIEVDDDSDASSVRIDLSAFRSLRGMRRM
ncbi:hypothetical protein MMC25_006243 [Agyrium rufum]|nr:hypothetical protein [Agyrium rufum]